MTNQVLAQTSVARRLDSALRGKDGEGDDRSGRGFFQNFVDRVALRCKGLYKFASHGACCVLVVWRARSRTSG